MSETTILARCENETVVFRCASGNIHVAHKQASICMPAQDYPVYCHNVGKALESIREDRWDSPWVTVHYRVASLSMPVDEFVRFGNTVHQALAVLGEGEALSGSDSDNKWIGGCLKRIAMN